MFLLYFITEVLIVEHKNLEERKSTEHEAFWKSSRDSIREEAKAR